ncbi:MAG: hypothetical protein ACREU9_05310, partial [Gammaproteobacteria bacterium]
MMESTGVYGDTLRRQLREAGIEVHLMSAKRAATMPWGGLYRLYQKQHQQQQNRLEAALTRHWPELWISIVSRWKERFGQLPKAGFPR